MKKLLFFTIIVLIPLLYGCREILVKYSDNGKTVHMTVDQILKIQLPADAMSGNDWRRIAYEDTVIIKTGKPNYMLSDGRLDTPGIYNFRFKTIGAGTSKLYMEYGSKYDSNEKPVKTFEIVVIVHEKGK